MGNFLSFLSHVSKVISWPFWPNRIEFFFPPLRQLYFNWPVSPSWDVLSLCTRRAIGGKGKEMYDERQTETKLGSGAWETKRPTHSVMCMCLTMTARAHTQFKSISVVKSHTVALMWDQSGHQLVPLWESRVSFDMFAVTMAWQVCFHGNTFVTCVERGQSVGGESPMRTVGLEGKLITLMMIQSVSWGRMWISLLLL